MKFTICPVIVESERNVNIQKVEDYLKDFTEDLFNQHPGLKIYKEKLFIAGGCLRSLILGESVKDIDIFVKDSDTVNSMKNSLIYPRSDNAINFHVNSIKTQIIITETGSPLDVVNRFDFTMNMNFYDLVTGSIYVYSTGDILSKTLRVNKNCRNKLGTLARIVKFTERGYKIASKENLLELGCQISRMEPISTFKELEAESRLYFSCDDYDSIDFVEKDVLSTAKFESRRAGSGF